MRGLNSRLAAIQAAVIATCLLAAGPAAAQLVSVSNVSEPPAIDVRARSTESQHRSAIADVFTRVAKDPTTYALPPIIYTAHRLDWDSSQKLFARGYVEANPGFTVVACGAVRCRYGTAGEAAAIGAGSPLSMRSFSRHCPNWLCDMRYDQ